MINISFCCKCSDVVTKRTLDNHTISALEVVGCKKLTKQQWDDGLPKNVHEMWNQKNCPLLGLTPKK